MTTFLEQTIGRGLEVRYFATGDSVELRAGADGYVHFTGYATTYDTWYDVAGGPERGGWREMVVAGAGKRTLKGKPDVRLLVNHDGLPLARTKSKTLQLLEDSSGLISDAPTLDLSNPRVQEVRSAMGRKDVDEMSYAFRATRQEWNADYTERRIIEYALDVEGSDVSIVTYPANKATVATLRSIVTDDRGVKGIDEIRSAGLTSRTFVLSLDLAKAQREQLRRSA